MKSPRFSFPVVSPNPSCLTEFPLFALQRKAAATLDDGSCLRRAQSTRHPRVAAVPPRSSPVMQGFQEMTLQTRFGLIPWHGFDLPHPGKAGSDITPRETACGLLDYPFQNTLGEYPT